MHKPNEDRERASATVIRITGWLIVTMSTIETIVVESSPGLPEALNNAIVAAVDEQAC